LKAKALEDFIQVLLSGLLSGLLSEKAAGAVSSQRLRLR